LWRTRQAGGVFGGPRIARLDARPLGEAGAEAVRLYAIEEVLSEPEPSGHDRWNWGVQTRLVVSGPLLTRAPTLHQIGVAPKSVRSHSHIRLTEEQGRQAEQVIRCAAERYGTPAPASQ
jgi:hypothetical protein